MFLCFPLTGNNSVTLLFLFDCLGMKLTRKNTRSEVTRQEYKTNRNEKSNMLVFKNESNASKPWDSSYWCFFSYFVENYSVYSWHITVISWKFPKQVPWKFKNCNLHNKKKKIWKMMVNNGLVSTSCVLCYAIKICLLKILP